MTTQRSTLEATKPIPDGARRLVFVDVLRVAVIVMVIAHHAAQAYGPTGGNWPVTDSASSDWFRPFYTVNAAVGLGLLFLLAGYFVPKSLDRKGPGRFLRERWARIGIPLVVFAFGVHLPFVYLWLSRPPFGEFIDSMYDAGWQGLYLHLWFLGHLLLYSAVYVIWRKIRDRAGRPPRSLPPPGHGAIVTFVLALAVLTWIVRMWFPVDEWVPLLLVLAAEPANLLQYTSLFALGVLAYRGDWLRRIPTRVGMIWLGLGLAAATTIYVLEAVGRWDQLVATGGLNTRSLVFTSLGALICAGLSVGLVVLFRQLFRRPRPLLVMMATASYAAYILHFWVVIGLQSGIEGLVLPAGLKFALVTALGVIFSFGAGHLSSKVPGIRVILGTKNPPRGGTGSDSHRGPGVTVQV